MGARYGVSLLADLVAFLLLLLLQGGKKVPNFRCEI